VERPEIGLDELVAHWTVLDGEKGLVAGKRGATRLGFALLLKFYTHHGRFPRGRAEFPAEVIAFVARQMQVPASELVSTSGLGARSSTTVPRSVTTWGFGFGSRTRRS
jgi:hypothetical protein